ncbi:MAG: UDP-N-acetyl glucosamine 2-epimerase, partial [Chloroflexi bacterium]|nr:UDP-N-acetyl glucosamine 2-epimerase [Chloroflexota bacterium]
NTERPVTVTQGTNTVVGSDPQRIVAEALAVLDGRGKAVCVPELWDGKAAERIVQVISSHRSSCPSAPLLLCTNWDGRAAGCIVKVLGSWQGRRMRKLPEEV